MEKLIKFVQSPSGPAIETIGKMVMALHVPYSDKSITIQINPFLQDYQENNDQPGMKVRHIQVTTTTPDTKTLAFDFKDNITHNINIEDVNYEITLMNIGKEATEHGNFLSFEFKIKTN